MNRKHLVVGGAIAVIAALLLWLVFRGGDDGGKERQATAPDRETPGARAGATDAEREELLREAAERAAERPDPAGRLLLEGQVLGGDDQPVGGAEVWISTQPPRSTKSEEDGSFQFDKLLPREYALYARDGDQSGGPVMVQMGPKTEPLVIRLREGAALTVRVTAEADGAPVSGAEVELREMGSPKRTTDAQGVATFRGLPQGWSLVVVRASGYASASTAATVGAPGSTQEVSIALRKGAPVSGKVVDEAGQPIAGAYVTMRESGSMFGLDVDAARSGDDGAFTFPIVAAGSYHVGARDGEHAPGVSELITVDGVTARDGVVITMKPSAIVRGRVITKQREPAPFAAVQIAPKDLNETAMFYGFGDDAGARVTADEQGAFEIKGLPRVAARIRASNDLAASAITDLDLAASPTIEGLELMLDVEGVIAGVVVDSKGEPVAEAQVSAMVDILGGAKLEDAAFGGFNATTTDGGGAFRLHGLPEGAYRLWASRTSAMTTMFATEGTKARTGDTSVKIVLPAPGGIEGKIAYADGKAPERALVSVSMMPASPTNDGAFEIRELPPGSYDVRVRGPDFAELVQRDVVVEAGATKDLGTLVVKRGRKVSGRVVDGAGAPVAGARVVAGQMLFSEGSTTGGNQVIEEQMGVRSATSNADGTFLIQGAPEKGGSIMAEHTDRGRSDAVALAAGDTDVPGVMLTLRGFGSVAGKVTMDGQPVPSAQVMVAGKASKGHVVVVSSGPDGAFAIDKLPEGEHRLSATQMQGFQMTSASQDVTVVAGQRTEVELEIPVGQIVLTVEVKGEGGKKIDAAQIFLFRGAIAARTAEDITERFLGGDAQGMAFWFGGAELAKFEKLLPGEYSVCTLPINGNLADMQFQQRLNDNLDKLAVHCHAKTIAATPNEQRHVAVVPPMSPLP